MRRDVGVDTGHARHTFPYSMVKEIFMFIGMLFTNGCPSSMLRCYSKSFRLLYSGRNFNFNVQAKANLIHALIGRGCPIRIQTTSRLELSSSSAILQHYKIAPSTRVWSLSRDFNCIHSCSPRLVLDVRSFTLWAQSEQAESVFSIQHP